MNVLFIDHACHRQTCSSDFMRELLARRHQVDSFYFSRHYDCSVPREKLDWADLVVFVEFIPFRFAAGLTGKRCLFLPMYDNEWGSKWWWRRLALLGMNVISFCARVGEHARRCGVRNVLDVRFAFDPARFAGSAGDPRQAVFWDRGVISPQKVRSLFAPDAIDRLVVYRDFLPREEYLKLVASAGVYVAPRYKEGIGMAFLEQLARGKCVIAHADATMDEYLDDGVTGVLTDLHNPRVVSAAEIERIRANVPAHAERLYRDWLVDETRILEFVDALRDQPPLASPWSLKSIVWYGLYWIEGALMRLRHGT